MFLDSTFAPSPQSRQTLKDCWGFHQLLVFKDQRLILFKETKRFLCLLKNDNLKMTDFANGYDIYRNQWALLIPIITIFQNFRFLSGFLTLSFYYCIWINILANSKANYLSCFMSIWHLFIDFILCLARVVPRTIPLRMLYLLFVQINIPNCLSAIKFQLEVYWYFIASGLHYASYKMVINVLMTSKAVVYHWK